MDRASTRLVAGIAVSVWMSTCGTVTTPTVGSAGTHVGSHDDPILLSGRVSFAGAEIQARANRSDGTVVPLLPVGRAGTTARTVPGSTASWYDWSLPVRIPDEFWQPCDRASISAVALVPLMSYRLDQCLLATSGCLECRDVNVARNQATCVIARPLPMFDDYALTTCIPAKLSAGRTREQADAECGLPSMLITAAPAPPDHAHVGDLTVTNATEAGVFECVTTIDGRLAVQTGSPQMGLPRLTSVTGDVTLLYRNAWAATEATAAPRLDLNRLATIGRSTAPVTLTITSQATGHGLVYDVGLGGLTTLFGSLVVNKPQAAKPQGLPQLLSVSGDLTLTGNEIESIQLANNVATVQGNVTVRAGAIYNRPRFADSLVTIGGALRFDSYLLSPGIRGGSGIFGSIFPALRTVGGLLLFEQTRGALPTVGDTTAAGMQIGALSMLDTSFAAAEWASLAANIHVAGTGTIDIENNRLICQSAASAFVAANGGCAGRTVTVASNGAGVAAGTCAACPAAPPGCGYACP